MKKSYVFPFLLVCLAVSFFTACTYNVTNENTDNLNIWTIQGFKTLESSIINESNSYLKELNSTCLELSIRKNKYSNIAYSCLLKNNEVVDYYIIDYYSGYSFFDFHYEENDKVREIYFKINDYVAKYTRKEIEEITTKLIKEMIQQIKKEIIQAEVDKKVLVINKKRLEEEFN
jgi:hypothetical protein